MNGSLRMATFLQHFVQVFEAALPGTANKEPEASNVRAVRACYEAIARGDPAALAAAMSEDVLLEIVGPPHMPINGRWEGRGPVLAATARNFAQFTDQRPELNMVRAEGDMVFVIAQETGTYLPTRKVYDLWWMHAFRLRAGKVIHIRGTAYGAGPWE